MNTTAEYTAEEIAREILRRNGLQGEPHPALLEDTVREVEYHGTPMPQDEEPDANAGTEFAENHPLVFKSYNVIGLDVYGVRRIVKTEARDVAEARENARWVLDKVHRVIRP